MVTSLVQTMTDIGDGLRDGGREEGFLHIILPQMDSIRVAVMRPCRMVHILSQNVIAQVALKYGNIVYEPIKYGNSSE